MRARGWSGEEGVRRFPVLLTSGWRIALAALALCLLPFNAVPATDASRFDQAAHDLSWQLTSFAGEAGLTGQRVFDITFETNGVVWIAASDGLRRFDGYVWQTFRTNDGLPSSFVRSVCVTRSGELWVGTDAGAGVFNAATRRYDPRGSEKGLASVNVRHIAEDPDGSLWFCCDQWPDSSGKRGGLSVLREGRWQSFGRADGLPMDYVITYFRDSEGRQFASTPQGWMQRRENGWDWPEQLGHEQESRVLHFTESREGELFAQGESRLLRLADGRWQVVNEPTALVGCDRQGRVLALCRDAARGTLWFGIWNGRGFGRASATFAAPLKASVYRLAQAPDGSVWCVGYDTVVRWAYQAGPWDCYPDLLPPRMVDSRGQPWFWNASNVVVRLDGEMKWLPRVQAVKAIGRDGALYGLIAGSGQLASATAEKPEQWSLTGCEIDSVRDVVIGARGEVWVTGNGSYQAVQIAWRDEGRWHLFAPEELRGQRVGTVSADPSEGVWAVVFPPDDAVNYRVAHVTKSAVIWDEATTNLPPLMYPHVRVAAGECWLIGYSGIFHRPLDASAPWRPVTDLRETGFQFAGGNDSEAMFVFTGGNSGRSGCALYHNGRWQIRYEQVFSATPDADDKVYYFSARQGVFIRKEPGTLNLELLPLPAELLAGQTVRDRAGQLWIGTSQGVLRYQPTSDPPGTVVESLLSEVQSGAVWPVTFHGRSAFSTVRMPDAYDYSWRYDDGEWSAFQPWPGQALRVPKLPVGAHQLQVRARDWAGHIDPTPAEVAFTVLPSPLQNRAWFWPVVGLTGGLIGWLCWLGIAHTREIARRNLALGAEVAVRRRTEEDLKKAREELEHRVRERTAELARANMLLHTEICERERAQEAQKHLEEQLRHTHKMEAIGTLAGGIAHDFNNILAAMVANVHLALREAEGRPAQQERLNQVLVSAERAKMLVQQILAFSRKQQEQEQQVLDLLPLVKETLKLLRAAIPATIEIEPHFAPDLPCVMADPTQIHQVLMNLCTNAEYAMRGRAGRLQVRLEPVELKSADADTHPPLPAGRYLRISVHDNGRGMKPEVLARVFEPFFTTKRVGEGTGLGLAVVHGIVKNHRGGLRVRSEVDRGTVFEVLLPACEGQPVQSPASDESRPAGAGEHILYVDDEEAIGEAVQMIMEMTGYRVTVHQRPVAALEAFKQAPDDFHLVVTDYAMPVLTGVDLAAQIREIRPDLPIVLVTGFGAELTPESVAKAGFRRVLNKPFNPGALSAVAHELLRGEG